MMSVSAGCVPRYGAISILAPLRRLNSMVARCPAEPTEVIAKVHSAGLAFAAAITSAIVVCGRDGVITITSGAMPVRATTSRSDIGSNGRFGVTRCSTTVLKAEASSV